jgi:hypothetical protein
LLLALAGLAALAMTLLPHDFSVITTTTIGSFVTPS